MVPLRAAPLALLVFVLALGLLADLSQQQQRMDDGDDDYPAYGNPVRPAEKDLVADLPGLNEPINFNHYSGYLRADNETKPSKFLHYWFVESQSNSSVDDPVILWLNGGPGCSSLGGFFTELGPFKVNEDGETLALNPYSWNKQANVLFLESPSGVGFSYSLPWADIHTDDTTALENYLALKSFMEKFPQFANNPLYLMGQSYAGVYLPTLGLLVDADPELNLKGIAIGNGLLDAAKRMDSLVFFGYYHGLVGKSVWDKISQHCCDGRPPARESCTLSGPESSERCGRAVKEATYMLYNYPGLYPYNMYGPCPTVKQQQEQQVGRSSRKIVDGALARDSRISYDDHERLLHAFGARHHVTAAVQAKHHARLSKPCPDHYALAKYLNQPTVREAIHIPKMVAMWKQCFFEPYMQRYALQPAGLAPQINQLIESKRKLRLLVYNGDLDMVCNFLGVQWFVDDLGRKVISDYSAWNVGNHVAGFVKHYDGITFATVLGAGHSVPADRPQEALAMIKIFLDPLADYYKWP